MPDIHHKYSPSQLQYLELCPARAEMSALVPETTSPAAQDGILCHKAIETGEFSSLSAEQLTNVEKCLEHLNKDMTWTYEHRVVVNNERLEVMTFGTVDAMAYDTEKDRYLLRDWKFGRTGVEPCENNLQAWAYALAVIQDTGKDVEFTFVQPKIGWVSTAVFSVFESHTYYNRIFRIIERAKNEPYHMIAGDRQCKYCKAASICPAFRAKYMGLELASNGTMPVIEGHTHELAGAKLSEYYRKWLDFDESYKQVKKVSENLKHAITQKLVKGEVEGLEGFSLKPKKGNREVVDPNGLYSEIQQELDVQDYLKCVKIQLGKLETAYCDSVQLKTGAKKTESKKKLSEIVEKYSERTSDGYKLICKFEDAEPIETTAVAVSE